MKGLATTELRLAYLGGMIDGEGSIGLYLRHAQSLRLRVQVANTNRDLLTWFQLHFGGIVSRGGQRHNPQHKALYMWFCDGENAVEIIRVVEPYLVIKGAQANLALEAWANRRAVPLIDRRKPMPEGVVEMRQDYVNQMHKLNKKGATA